MTVPEQEGVIRIGTPLRDAAVDPRPGDASVPTNAGLADPHSPLVVAPEALTRQEQAYVAQTRDEDRRGAQAG